MGLDIRIPLGYLFVSLGAILTSYGGLTWGKDIYSSSMAVNPNFFWGAWVFLFGIAMLLLEWRSRLKTRTGQWCTASRAKRQFHGRMS